MIRHRYLAFSLAFSIAALSPSGVFALSYDEIMLLVQAERKVFGQPNNTESFDDRIKALEAKQGGAGAGSDSQRLRTVCRSLGLLPAEAAPVASAANAGKTAKAATPKGAAKVEKLAKAESLANKPERTIKGAKIAAALPAQVPAQAHTVSAKIESAAPTAARAPVKASSSGGDSDRLSRLSSQLSAVRRQKAKQAVAPSRQPEQQAIVSTPAQNVGTVRNSTTPPPAQAVNSAQNAAANLNQASTEMPSTTATQPTTPLAGGSGTEASGANDQTAPHNNSGNFIVGFALIIGAVLMAIGFAIFVVLKGRPPVTEHSEQVEEADDYNSTFPHRPGRANRHREPVNDEPQSLAASLKADAAGRKQQKEAVEELPPWDRQSATSESSNANMPSPLNKSAQAPQLSPESYASATALRTGANPVIAEPDPHSFSIAHLEPVAVKASPLQVTLEPPMQSQGFSSGSDNSMPYAAAPPSTSIAGHNASVEQYGTFEQAAVEPKMFPSTTGEAISQSEQIAQSPARQQPANEALRSLFSQQKQAQEDSAGLPGGEENNLAEASIQATDSPFAQAQAAGNYATEQAQDQQVSNEIDHDLDNYGQLLENAAGGAGAEFVEKNDFYSAEENVSVAPSIKTVQNYLSDAPPPVVKFKKCSACGKVFSLDVEVCNFDKSRLGIEEINPALSDSLNDKYVIQSVTGSGGMSIVYRAFHKALNKPVAIKVLEPRLITNTAAVRRFEQEVQQLSQVSHPNVAAILDFGITAEGLAYVVMDYLTGKPLSDILETYSSVPSFHARRLLLQCASGLGNAHQAGIVHGDLKPSNIIFEKDPAGDFLIKLVDFGVANLSSIRPVTTPAKDEASPYLSPEQCMGNPPDALSDIFSLGCVMFHMLTGSTPFRSTTGYGMTQMIVSANTPSLRATRPDLNLPEQFEAIVNKAMRKEPVMRYQNMDELIKELVRVPV